ncbi:MAG: Do family serine endopeptidase [Bacteroidia bacterium]|nr:Do family serine endopeptidase [Bacteroidia bacterium]
MDIVKKIASTLAIAFAGAILAIFLYSKIINPPRVVELQGTTPAQLTSYSSPSSPQAQLPDLTQAAEKSVHAVVHITTKMKAQGYNGSDNPLFDFFFGPRGNNAQPRGYNQEPEYSMGAGSGVIIGPEGYIVTNSHVIEDADNIEVVLNDNRKFTAKVIGRDPNTDIALVKIEAKELPFLTWGNSEALRLGEWVLAVGNPFNLTSTVTAGIVSAKSRSIGIMGGQMPLESFIQTDAAVNPGNSGGALVNASGELVGINAAIASRTGSYTGYSFAVPASIARKVVDDLKQYGEVQRALLGVEMKPIDDDLAKEKNLDKIEGVYVVRTTDEGAARQAGIKAGDVITAVNGNLVNAPQQLQEQIGKYRPGDKVAINVKRNGEVKQFNVVLRNTKGDTSIVKESFSVLGAEFAPITEKDKERLKIDEGIQVINLSNGKLKEAGVKIGFIITDINKSSVSSVEDIKRVLSQSSNKKPVLVEGVYPGGDWTYYVFKMED